MGVVFFLVWLCQFAWVSKRLSGKLMVEYIGLLLFKRVLYQGKQIRSNWRHWIECGCNEEEELRYFLLCILWFPSHCVVHTKIMHCTWEKSPYLRSIVSGQMEKKTTPVLESKITVRRLAVEGEGFWILCITSELRAIWQVSWSWQVRYTLQDRPSPSKLWLKMRSMSEYYLGTALCNEFGKLIRHWSKLETRFTA